MRSVAQIPLDMFCDHRMTGTRGRILAALLKFTNRDGVCWRSQEHLAQDAHVALRDLQRACKSIVEFGWMTRARTKRGYRYTLPWAAVCPQTPVNNSRATVQNAPTPTPEAAIESSKGDKDSVELSNTESTVDEQKSKKQTRNPFGPWNKPDKARAVRGWLGWLGEYVRDCCKFTGEQMTEFWTACMDRADGKRSGLLDELTLQAQGSAWYRARQRKIFEVAERGAR